MTTKTKKAPDPPRGDIATIEDLFSMMVPDIPCEYVIGTVPNTKPCKNHASWAIHLRGHCDANNKTIKLVCDDCLLRIKSGDVWKCRRCSARASIIDYITKIERI